MFLPSAESSGSEAHDQLQQRLAEITSLTAELAAAKDKIATYSKVQEIRTIRSSYVAYDKVPVLKYTLPYLHIPYTGHISTQHVIFIVDLTKVISILN